MNHIHYTQTNLLREIGQVDGAVASDFDWYNLHAGHLSTGRISAVSRLRYQTYL